MKYADESAIFSLVASFERGTIARDEWRHAEHLTVALCYLFKYDDETALAKMRAGLFNLLQSFGVDLKIEMPYHETLTVFWMRTVDDFRKTKNGDSIIKICNELVGNFDKDYPLKFYSRELLFSDEARRNFVAGDL